MHEQLLPRKNRKEKPEVDPLGPQKFHNMFHLVIMGACVLVYIILSLVR